MGNSWTLDPNTYGKTIYVFSIGQPEVRAILAEFQKHRPLKSPFKNFRREVGQGREMTALLFQFNFWNPRCVSTALKICWFPKMIATIMTTGGLPDSIKYMAGYQPISWNCDYASPIHQTPTKYMHTNTSISQPLPRCLRSSAHQWGRRKRSTTWAWCSNMVAEQNPEPVGMV